MLSELKETILKMRDRDYEARIKVLSFRKKDGNLAVIPTEHEIAQNIIKIDQAHNAILKEIVQKHGWPDTTLVGKEGEEAFWNLIQHQDKDIAFQKECLVMLDEAVKRGKAEAKHLAYLVDRIRKNENLPQLYGTQWFENGGKMALYVVEDPEGLDNRRKAVDLPPWNEEKRKMMENFQLSEDAFE